MPYRPPRINNQAEEQFTATFVKNAMKNVHGYLATVDLIPKERYIATCAPRTVKQYAANIHATAGQGREENKTLL